MSVGQVLFDWKTLRQPPPVRFEIGETSLLLDKTLYRCHDTQHNDIQHNDTQRKGLISDIQHNDTQHNATQHNDTIILCWVSRLIYCYALCHYTERRYAECRYAECRGATLLGSTLKVGYSLRLQISDYCRDRWETQQFTKHTIINYCCKSFVAQAQGVQFSILNIARTHVTKLYELINYRTLQGPLL
jgi:hypothetical protein